MQKKDKSPGDGDPGLPGIWTVAYRIAHIVPALRNQKSIYGRPYSSSYLEA